MMKFFKRQTAKGTVTLLAFLMVTASAQSSKVKRVNLFDVSGNHLMFVEFEYDASGTDTARSIYMSDSTFLRRTIYKNNPEGKRLAETSFNFNKDTVFSTTFGTSESRSSMTVRDQFGVDQLGSPVSFSESSTDHFDVFQNNSAINRISYEKNGEGIYSRINVLDASGGLQYYATLDYEGSANAISRVRSAHLPPAMLVRGTFLELQFHLEKKATIKCELLSLSGKKVATLFSGPMANSTNSNMVRISLKEFGFADGVYLASLSVDGRRVAKKKIIVQGQRGGF